MWEAEDFLPGQVATVTKFWENEILPACPPEQVEMYCRWLEGGSVHEFVDEKEEGTFQGHAYRGIDLTPIELSNHVWAEHHNFVHTTIAGDTRPWHQVADVSIHRKPHMVTPLGVEPSKPRVTF